GLRARQGRARRGRLVRGPSSQRAHQRGRGQQARHPARENAEQHRSLRQYLRGHHPDLARRDAPRRPPETRSARLPDRARRRFSLGQLATQDLAQLSSVTTWIARRRSASRLRRCQWMLGSVKKRILYGAGRFLTESIQTTNALKQLEFMNVSLRKSQLT